MILKGMLKWAVGKDDLGPINPTKSLKKQHRRKTHQPQLDMQRDAGGVGLISGCCKHRNNNIQVPNPSRILTNNKKPRAPVGVINNESDNGKVNGHNYKAPDQKTTLLSRTTINAPSSTTTTLPVHVHVVHTPTSSPHHHQNNNNNNTINNSDSKSLLYMRLDHLPMAIVKQYERMLRDAPFKPAPKSVLKSQQQQQRVTNCSNSSSNNNNSPNHQNRPSNPKAKNQKPVSPPHKKSHSKSITFKEDVNEGKINNPTCLNVNLKASSTEISIKEAQHRPLKILSASISPSSKKYPSLPQSTIKIVKSTSPLSSPREKRLSQNVVLVDHPKRKMQHVPVVIEKKSPKLPAKKSTFICDKSVLNSVDHYPTKGISNAQIISESTKLSSHIPQNDNENDENDPNSVPKIPAKLNYGKNLKVSNNNPLQQAPPSSTNVTGPGLETRLPFPHDTTDPQFLEPKPITYSTQPVAKCAKKLTLKRSELKKLERLKTQTERLNRFLQKYYHDCLPNLPEDEEDSCSPEEKSVRLSILRTHWKEVKSSHPQQIHPNHQERRFLHHQNQQEMEADEEVEESEESSLPLNSCYENVTKSYKQHKFPYSNPKECNKFSPLHTSSFASSSYTTTLPELSVDDYSVTWENILNASPRLSSSSTSSSYPSSDPSPPTGHLPIILEDSGEISSSNNSEYHHQSSHINNHHHEQGDVEMVRDGAAMRMLGLDESFLMSRTRIETEDSLLHLNLKESCLGLSDEKVHHPLQAYHRDRMSDNFSTSVKISYDEEEEDDKVFGGGGGDEGGGFGMEKLKGLLFQPLGEELFDPPASLLEDEGFMSPYPPEAYSPASSSSTSTFNRFSVSSSSGKGSTSEGDQAGEEVELEEEGHDQMGIPENNKQHGEVEQQYFEDDYDKEQSNLGRTSSQSSSSSSTSTSSCSSNKSNSSSSSGQTDQEITSTMEGGPKYIIMEEEDLKHENANYLIPLPPTKVKSVMEIERSEDCCNNHNETWNSHGYVPTSPCGTISSSHSSSSSHQSTSTTAASTVTNSSYSPFLCDNGRDEAAPAAQVERDENETLNFNSMRNQRENDHNVGDGREEESFISNKFALAFSTPARQATTRRRALHLPQTCLRYKKQSTTPRKVVKKPPVNSTLSGKGELLIRTYKNDGDYVTVHVVQARRLETHCHSSWKLSIKVSYLPEAETTFTRSSETILVPRNRSWVKIDQKFSFELPLTLPSSNTKVFLTAVKRLGKKSTFLGWTTLALPNEEKTQSWLKLRKRKMSTTTTTNYSMQSCHHSSTLINNNSQTPQPPNKGGQRRVEVEVANSARSSSSMDSPSPQPGHPTDNGGGGGGGSSSSSRCDCEMDSQLMPKSQLQNSSTMDSGVEDCCEPPPPPAPSIDLDDKNGVRIGVRMMKPDAGGYGFSVVWVSPPRIERLEKGGRADMAGLRIGDLIIGVNGEDVGGVPNTTIYTKMKTTGSELRLEVWRTTPPIQSRSTHHSHNRAVPMPSEPVIIIPTPPPTKTPSNPNSTPRPPISTNVNEGGRGGVGIREVTQTPPPKQQLSTGKQSQSSPIPKPIISNNVNSNINQNLAAALPPSSSSRIQSHQPPPTSILKPPPPAPPTSIETNNSSQKQQQPQPGSSAWRIKFNIELLDNEDDCLKQFFICELKFFRKIVAALDRYLIPAQSNRLLTPQEINLMFANVIKIITVTKRILNCIASGSSGPGWQLGGVLLSTHSDHLSEIVSAYSAYAKTLGYSSMILSDKMSLQEFARFVLETPVPKGHLDLTSLLFAPLEHLRNICEICEEISHNNSEAWMDLFTQLKECYADIVCETDFMEPISHVSMKKNPLLTVRDLEKRVVSTSCQPVKVCEKGRRWLFGSRLFKKESDGSWSPVWAFLFSDIIVLTSHTTRDRVFFVKEAPIRLADVVTLHFNLPKKHENEFRLLFEPEPVYQSRLDKLLPLHRNKKSHQIALRTPNIQLKSIWKLLLQRQIITLNTRLSKSASSNFSISEFCERFPITPQGEDEQDDLPRPTGSHKKGAAPPIPTTSNKTSGGGGLSKTIFDRQNFSDERNLSVIKEEKLKPQFKPYAPDGLSSMSKELLKSRVPTRILTDRNKGRGVGASVVVESIPEEIKVTANKPPHDPTDINGRNYSGTQAFGVSSSAINSNKGLDTSRNDEVVVVGVPSTQHFTNTNMTTTTGIMQSQTAYLEPPKGINGTSSATSGGLRSEKGNNQARISSSTISSNPPPTKEQDEKQRLIISRPSTSISIGNQTIESNPSPSPTNNNNNNNNNNNEIINYNQSVKTGEKCPCADIGGGDGEEEKVNVNANNATTSIIQQAPAVKPRTNYGNSQPVKPIRAMMNDPSRRNSETLSSPSPAKKIESPRPAPRPDLQRNSSNNNNNVNNQNKIILSSSPSPAPSPSMSNNRVDALKYEGGLGSSSRELSSKSSSKPGSKILTNSTLKSRQQGELIVGAQKEGQTIITMVEKPSTNSANDSDCILISQHIEPRVMVVATKDASSSPLLAPRCQSENGFIKPKTVHTDSPILSGFGSEKSRRRVLYDYKIQRDYPELFGITPRDRRTFIKQLAERKPENEKPLVAPYYFSPVPTPKFAKRSGDEGVELKSSTAASSTMPSSSALPPSFFYKKPSAQKPGPSSSSPSCSNPNNNNNSKPSVSGTSGPTGSSSSSGPGSKIMVSSSNTITTTTHNNSHQNSKLLNELKTRLIQQNVVESEVVGENEMSLKDMARGILRNGHSDDEEDDEEEEEEEEAETSEESEESDECHLSEEVRAQVHRQRSPEESSNDSGISDELTEKRKSQQNGKESGNNFQSTMAVNTSEVKLFSSKKMSSSTIVTQKSQLLPKNKSAPSHASHCISSSPHKVYTRSKNKTDDHVCFDEGEEETGMASMVVLKKADKCTGTDDGYFSHTMSATSTTTTHHTIGSSSSSTFTNNHFHAEKSMRTLMAERREAFFASYNNTNNNQNSYSSPSSSAITTNTFRTNSFHHSPVHHYHHQYYQNHANSSSSPYKTLEPLESPLRVRIVDGGTLQSTNPEPILRHQRSPPSERVLLTRFPEKERNARVERVEIESSDDSTSSDLASASPAAENGTTDPSWSSSSSSLAGGTTSTSCSKQEEPSTSISTLGATSIYNGGCSGGGNSQSINSQVASSSSHISKIFMSDFTNGLLPNTSFSSGSLALSGNNYNTSTKNNNNYGPEIVVTQESPETPTVHNNGYSSEGEEEDSVLLVCKGGGGKSANQHHSSSSEGGDQVVTTVGGKKSFLRVESNDSTAENFGDDDDYNFDDEDDLSQCSVATINRYGTYESLEKIEENEEVGGSQDFSNKMTRSKARFTFDDDDSDDDNDLFEEDFESDFNFRFPSQIQDNTYSVSRLGPLPPLLEEDFEDDMYDEQHGAGSSSSSPGPLLGSSSTTSLVNGGSTLRARHETGLRHDNSFLLARLATMYARSSISPLKILRDLWIKKRYRQSENWKYKE